MLQAQHCSFSIFLVLHPHKPSFAPSNLSFYKPLKTIRPVRAQKLRRAPPEQWLAQAQDEPTTATVDAPPPPPEEGPIELPSSAPSIFGFSDEPTPIQTATSVLLTGAISVFLFRALRRRAKRAKEMVKPAFFPLEFWTLISMLSYSKFKYTEGWIYLSPKFNSIWVYFKDSVFRTIELKLCIFILHATLLLPCIALVSWTSKWLHNCLQRVYFIEFILMCWGYHGGISGLGHLERRKH